MSKRREEGEEEEKEKRGEEEKMNDLNSTLFRVRVDRDRRMREEEKAVDELNKKEMYWMEREVEERER